MLTRSSEYALRALIDLARHQSSGRVSRDDMARRTGIPARYLSKILSDLVRIGLLASMRGPGGGFSLARPAHEVPLSEIVALYEPHSGKRCPFGNRECSDTNPCVAHDRWKIVLETQRAFLENTTLEAVAFAAGERAARAPDRERGERRGESPASEDGL